MALFKMLHGDAARISTDITPFHEGWCYVTNDGYMYVDMNIGTEDEPNNQRVKLNASEAETLLGISTSVVLNSTDLEIPTSKAVLEALANKANVADLPDFSEVQMMSKKFNSSVSWNEDETVFTETWTYNENSYRQVLTEVSATQWTKQLYVNNVLTGTWALTIDEVGMVANTVYTEQ